MRIRDTHGRRGHSVVEMAFIAPWLLFLFAGVFDVGYYTNAVLSTQNAARAAALYTSADAGTAADAALACRCAQAEMRGLANTRALTDCSRLPLIVTAQAVAGADGQPASRVAVTYQTDRLIPLPWMTGQLTVTRVAEVRIRM